MDLSKNRKNISVSILLLIFVFGGIFGFLYEEIFYRIDLGYFVKRGTTFGPWIPIYGFGALLITLLTNHMKKYPIAVFFSSMFLAGGLEYLTGYFLYHFFGIRLWNYQEEIWNWGNVGGFICLRSILFFACSGLFLQYVVHPLFLHLAKKWGPQKLKWIAGIPAAFFTADILISLFYRIFFS